jgi:hypothetical protein
MNSRLNGWPMCSPSDLFAVTLMSANALLGADVDHYSFIVVDLHVLLFAGFNRRTKHQDF